MFTKIDYTNLEDLQLGGKVGIDGLQGAEGARGGDRAGRARAADPDGGDPCADKNSPPGSIELLAFTIGPDNPDFVPYDRISPHLISSLMTTEDNGFFKHRGWVTPEFKTALRRNLPGAGSGWGPRPSPCRW